MNSIQLILYHQFHSVATDYKFFFVINPQMLLFDRTWLLNTAAFKNLTQCVMFLCVCVCEFNCFQDDLKLRRCLCYASSALHTNTINLIFSRKSWIFLKPRFACLLYDKRTSMKFSMIWRENNKFSPSTGSERCFS